ncbi:MAG: NfeD family protein, partial [Polaromonas sp.]
IGLPGMDRGPPGKDGDAGKGSGKEGKPDVKPSANPADTMTAKQVNDAAAFIRGLAQLRGRNAVWAERAVREAVSLTSSEALRDKVIDVVAKDLPDLLSQIDGRTVRVQGADLKLATRGLAHDTRLPDWRQRLLSVVANPSFALILMMIGIYGLMFEFSSPSFGVAGVAGAICLFLALFALQLLPVNYAALALILLGVALLVAELLSPSFGVFGAGGVIAFIAGGILLFDHDAPGFGVPLPLILALAASSAAVILLGGGLALKARRRPVVSGREELPGASGEVLEVADGETWARVRGERWRVTSQQPLVPGQRIRVLGLHGLTLEVQIDTQPKPTSEGVTS